MSFESVFYAVFAGTFLKCKTLLGSNDTVLINFRQFKIFKTVVCVVCMYVYEINV